MGLSRTDSKIDGDFRWKWQNFPTPLYFAPPLKGFPWKLGIGARGQKTRIMGYRAEKWVWRYLQSSGYNIPTWRTDGRTDTGRQQRPRLHIASRGKNQKCFYWSFTSLVHFCPPPIFNLGYAYVLHPSCCTRFSHVFTRLSRYHCPTFGTVWVSVTVLQGISSEKILKIHI